MIEPVRRDPPPLPTRVVAGQSWSRVSFLHWRVASERVAPLMPAGVVPDEHDGSSWVGLIAFLLHDATLGPTPPIPVLGTFAEVNVRLYARDDAGRRGVVFLSLEASRLAAVLAARAAFSIPYFWSRTSIATSEGEVSYLADRHRGPGSSAFTVQPGPELDGPDPLADFLTARWGLFTSRFGRTVYLPNTHERWPLRRATLVDLDDSLVALAGVTVTGAPESVLFSPGVRARFGAPLPVWNPGAP